MKVELKGGWKAFNEVCITPLGDKLKSGLKLALRREAQYLQGLMRSNITQQGALAGAPFAPHSPLTLVIRKMRGFGGRKILMQTGTLRNSITISPVAGGLFVGVMRSKGKANLGEIHETGIQVSRPMSPKQRRFIFAALKQLGSTGGMRGPGVLTIRIPARPFIGPVLSKFADPDDIAARVWKTIDTFLQGKLG